MINKGRPAEFSLNWDGWMASLTRWTWVWVNSGSWWLSGRPGERWFMGSQRVGHDWATDLIWSDLMLFTSIKKNLPSLSSGPPQLFQSLPCPPTIPPNHQPQQNPWIPLICTYYICYSRKKERLSVAWHQSSAQTSSVTLWLLCFSWTTDHYVETAVSFQESPPGSRAFWPPGLTNPFF